jgi:hypothetical protein
MKPTERPPFRIGAVQKVWLCMCGAGVLVVAAGFSVPYLVLGHGGPTLDVPAAVEPSTSTPLPATEVPLPEGGSAPRDLLLRLSAGTLIVLGLGAAILILCRRWLQPWAKGGPDGQGEFELMESLHLGNRCCVHLVRVGGQHLLTGMDVTGLKAVVPLVDLEEELLGPGWEEDAGSLGGLMREWRAAAKAPAIEPISVAG